MNKPYLSPYLVFNGNAREAMEFYQKVLGGELEMSTFGESPMESPPDYKDKIMHATLGNDTMSFMASDTQPGNTQTYGSGVQLSLAGSDAEFLRKAFEGLSESGTVTMPLAKQFWGAEFGMLTDKFGISWMFNIDSPDPKEASA